MGGECPTSWEGTTFATELLAGCCAPTLVPNKASLLENYSQTPKQPKFNPSKKDLAINFIKSGVDCMKQPKGYRRTQFAGTTRHVLQFDVNERNKKYDHFQRHVSKGYFCGDRADGRARRC